MLLKYAVLGLLLERRGYGYELDQRLAARLGPAWQLSRTAVYGALDQLEQAGLIRGTLRPASSADRVARRAGRVVYDPTPEGEAAFASWIAQSAHRCDPIRSALALKVAVARPCDIPALRETVDHAEWLVRRALDDSTRASAQLPGGWPARAAELVRGGAQARLRGELAWLASVREALEDACDEDDLPSRRLAAANG
jgi:DNA-binding PadR family transcriptional regulator